LYKGIKLYRCGNVDWPDTFRPDPHLAHKMRSGLANLTFLTWAEKSCPPRINVCLQASLFFKKKNLMIKLLMFNKLKNFNKLTKLSKDVGKFDDKLIIQHVHHIHICTLTYTMYFSNFSTLKIHNTCFFQSCKILEHSCRSPKGK